MSVLGIPGYLPGITSDLMIVVISVWVYIACYLIAGIIAALAPARHYFKATRAFTETDDWVWQDVCIDAFLRALTFKYMSESSKKKT